jgi:hypothetical protein
VSGCEATALVCPSEFGRVGAANEGGSGIRRRKKEIREELESLEVR